MTDEKLNELLDDAKRTWLEPTQPDFQAMWGRIDREAFGEARNFRRKPSWVVYSIGLAATLVMGVGIGRLSMKTESTPTVATATTPDTNQYRVRRQCVRQGGHRVARPHGRSAHVIA